MVVLHIVVVVVVDVLNNYYHWVLGVQRVIVFLCWGSEEKESSVHEHVPKGLAPSATLTLLLMRDVDCCDFG